MYDSPLSQQLIRMGLLDNLEEALDSPDSTVRLCAAYVVSRLVRNSQVRAVHALDIYIES
jgi:hypothetical protein